MMPNTLIVDIYCSTFVQDDAQLNFVTTVDFNETTMYSIKQLYRTRDTIVQNKGYNCTMMCDTLVYVAHFKILHNKINNYLAITL